jgi:hypothetical protein
MATAEIYTKHADRKRLAKAAGERIAMSSYEQNQGRFNAAANNEIIPFVE